MKIEITAGGIYGADGELPIGHEMTVENEPTGWAGRYRVISGNSKAERVAVTNPVKTEDVSLTAEQLEAMTVVELKELAKDNGIDLADATLKADIIAAIQLAVEPKA